MAFYPTRIDFPFGQQPMILSEELDEEVFASFLSYARCKKFATKEIKNKRLCTLSDYLENLEKNDLIRPSGFIFHPSRAGSTLICNMLSELYNSRVVIESSVINKFSILKFIEKEAALELVDFSKIIDTYSVSTSTVNKVFFKFSSWISNFIEPIISSVKNTPWLYVYRHPIEVLVSNINRPTFLKYAQSNGINIACHITGFDAETVRELSIEHLACVFLAKNMKSILENISTNNCLIVEYGNIKKDFFTRILPHFNIEFDLTERQRIIERSQYYSKNTSKIKFVPDNEQKQELASASLNQYVKKYKLLSLYAALQKHEAIQKTNILSTNNPIY